METYMFGWIVAWQVVLFLACVFYFSVAALVAVNGARDIAEALGIRRDQGAEEARDE